MIQVSVRDTLLQNRTYNVCPLRTAIVPVLLRDCTRLLIALADTVAEESDD